MTFENLAPLLEKVESLVHQAAVLTTPRDITVTAKGEKDFVTNADVAVSNFFIQHLPALLEGSQVLSEEAPPPSNTQNAPLWVVDPIDGTTNFIFGLPVYCISVGLLWQGQPVLGVVYNPVMQELYTAYKGGGAFLNGVPIHVNTDAELKSTLLLAETNPYSNRTQTLTSAVIGELFLHTVDYRVTGSAALDICYLAAGRAGVFVTEQITPWDCAAGLAILAEAGGMATRWNGEAMDLQTGAILATNGLLHNQTAVIIQQACTR